MTINGEKAEEIYRAEQDIEFKTKSLWLRQVTGLSSVRELLEKGPKWHCCGKNSPCFYYHSPYTLFQIVMVNEYPPYIAETFLPYEKLNEYQRDKYREIILSKTNPGLRGSLDNFDLLNYSLSLEKAEKVALLGFANFYPALFFDSWLATKGFKGKTLYLLDLCPTPIEQTKFVTKFIKPHNQIEGIVADIRDLPFPDESLDFVTTDVILYYLNNKEVSKTLSQIKRVLKPGSLFLSREFYKPKFTSDFPFSEDEVKKLVNFIIAVFGENSTLTSEIKLQLENEVRNYFLKRLFGKPHPERDINQLRIFFEQAGLEFVVQPVLVRGPERNDIGFPTFFLRKPLLQQL